MLQEPVLPLAAVGANEDQKNHIWRSCCIEMDARALLFFSQLAISLTVLIFCLIRMVSGDAEWAKMTATFIIGVWLPAPRAGRN